MFHIRRQVRKVCALSDLELDRDELERVEEQFGTVVTRSPEVFIVILAGLSVTLVAGYLIGKYVGEFVGYMGGGKLARGLFAGVITTASLLGSWLYIYPLMLRRTVRKAMCDCGHVVCMRCGYHLKGIDPAARCPECGGSRSARSSSAVLSNEHTDSAQPDEETRP